nr:endonuclease/exonuclease/phosphatase family protein [Caldilineaceae bacterium]
GPNPARDAALATLQAANVDVIALQELNPAVAAAVHARLSDRFPYQLLDPQHGVTGMGGISRYPLHTTGQQIPGAWLGSPQVVCLDYHGTPVTLVNVHCVSVEFDGWNARAKVEWSIGERERQATALAEFAAAQPGPLIALGGFNTAEQSTAYQCITRRLHDAWRAAGHGLGHTFPGADSPGSARPVIAGVKAPLWLIRIDYIFYSSHWRPLAAWLGPGTGSSDHRPVVAHLALTEQARQQAGGALDAASA